MGDERSTSILRPDEDIVDFQIHDRTFADALARIPLPMPWEQLESESGRTYFADPRARKTTWKDPRFLPADWEQRINPKDGRVYFQYSRTRKTTYTDPRGCPSGGDMRLSRTGDVYFSYSPTRQTTLYDPRG